MAERNPQQLRRIDAVIVRVVLEQSRATGAVLDVEQHLYIRDPWNPTHLRRYARVPLAGHGKLRSTIQLQAVDRLDERLQHPLPRLPCTAEILECAQGTLVSVLTDHRRDLTAAQQLLRLDRDRVHEARPRRAIEDDP